MSKVNLQNEHLNHYLEKKSLGEYVVMERLCDVNPEGWIHFMDLSRLKF